MRKLTDDEAPYYGQPIISFYVDTEKLKGTKDDPERYKYNRVHRVRDGQFVMVSDEETSSAIIFMMQTNHGKHAVIPSLTEAVDATL